MNKHLYLIKTCLIKIYLIKIYLTLASFRSSILLKKSISYQSLLFVYFFHHYFIQYDLTKILSHLSHYSKQSSAYVHHKCRNPRNNTLPNNDTNRPFTSKLPFYRSDCCHTRCIKQAKYEQGGC